MGDPRKRRKKYSTPKHPWQKERIDEESAIRKEYGTRNKKEIWKMNSLIKSFHANAIKASALNVTDQSKKEFSLILDKLKKLGLLNQEQNSTNDVLNITVKDLFERRLQTVIVRKHLARSTNQARQFITHEHIFVNGKKITSPSYLVPVKDEHHIMFDPRSSLHNEDHPERFQPEKVPTIEEESKHEEAGEGTEVRVKIVEEKPKKKAEKKTKEEPKEAPKEKKVEEKEVAA
jgi:small subunit ribosomal protein S4